MWGAGRSQGCSGARLLLPVQLTGSGFIRKPPFQYWILTGLTIEYETGGDGSGYSELPSNLHTADYFFLESLRLSPEGSAMGYEAGTADYNSGSRKNQA